MSKQSEWAELSEAANQIIRDNPLTEDEIRQTEYYANLDKFFDIVEPDGQGSEFAEYEPWEISRLPAGKKSIYEKILKARALEVDLNQRICHVQPATYFIEALKSNALYLARVSEWSVGNEIVICKEIAKSLKKKLGKDYDPSVSFDIDSQDQVDFALTRLQMDSIYGLCWTLSDNYEEAVKVAQTRHSNGNHVVLESTVRDLLTAFCLTKTSTWRCCVTQVHYMRKEELKSQPVDMTDMRNLNFGMTIVVDSAGKTIDKYKSQKEVRLILVSDDEQIVTRTDKRRHFLVSIVSLPTAIKKVRIKRGVDSTLIRYIREWLYIHYLLLKVHVIEWWRSRRCKSRCHNDAKG